MIITTTKSDSIKPFLDKLYLPQENSHKGQNGKLLIIGGSKLFHSASIWAAEIASHFVDIVHYSSTVENNKVFLEIKKKFQNGIVVSKENLFDYVKEDDAVLIGSGMTRENYTKKLVDKLITNYPEKKFVFDAGALQMMEKKWLLKLKTPPILTPHQKEFELLFGINLTNKTTEEKTYITKENAEKYNCVILLKTVDDIVTDGKEVVIIKGGNAGLTKGGTGDILAGLSSALFTKNDPMTSGVIASYLEKRAGDELFKSYGYWYNNEQLIGEIPNTLNKVFSTSI